MGACRCAVAVSLVASIAVITGGCAQRTMLRLRGLA